MTKDEVVILVHGTFAGDPADEGSKWWQKGSDAWVQLEDALPNGVTMDHVFHWDKGPNSQRSRMEAGHKLLQRLYELEGRDHGYHLVGHSHGGSVIWECLKLAALHGRHREKGGQDSRSHDLDNLRSWTTIGTPFLEFVPAGRGGIPMPVPPKGKGRRLLKLFMKPARLAIRFIDLILFLMVAAIVVLFPIGIITAFIQDYTNTADVSPYLFLAMVLAMFAYAGVVLVGASAFMKFAEATQAMTRWLNSNLALRTFGEKWLGIVSKEDEALAALGASIDLHLPVIEERLPDKKGMKVFYSDSLFRSVRWLRNRLNPIYNSFVPSFGNRFISRQIASSIQGNDWPGCVAASATTNPCADPEFSPVLPKKVDEEVISLANHRAAEVIPEVRSLLYTFDGGNLQLPADLKADPTSGLVHNSYFSVPGVIELIASHIQLTTLTRGEERIRDHEHFAWIEKTKEKSWSSIDERLKQETG